METLQINTSIGDIFVTIKKVEGSIPVTFLHGVYFDHNLWNNQVNRIIERSVITIDMPLHGKSKNINKKAEHLTIVP